MSLPVTELCLKANRMTDPSPHPAHSPIAHPLFQAVAVVVLVLGLLGAFLLFSYRSTETAVEKASSNEARVLSTQLEGALRRIDMTVAFLRDHYLEAVLHASGSTADSDVFEHLQHHVKQLSRQFPEMVLIVIADENGQIRASSLDHMPDWDISDRDYFQQARATPSKDLQFSPTLVTKWQAIPTVAGYRAIVNSAGEFQGVVTIALNLPYFQSLLSDVDAGEQDVVSVRRSDDSRLVFRWPDAPAAINQTATQIPPYQQIQSGERSGVVRYAGSIDGIERIFAFQKLDDYPFFVLVGRAVNEQFALWRQTALVGTVLAFVTLVLLLIMQVVLRRSQESQAEVELRIRQLAQAVEQSPSTIVITNTDARIEYANEAFTRTSGYAVGEVIGKNPKILNAGRTPKGTYRELWATLTRGEVWRGEFTNTRKDGSPYIELATIAPIKQADGRVTHYVAVKEDVTERREAEARIQRLAYYDSVTGLPNRSLMWDRLKQAILASERSNTYGVLLLLDVDHFKMLNDTQGHEAGDALLRELAHRLQATLRADDTVARVGDDDFAIVVEAIGTDHIAAIAHAEKIAEQLYQTANTPYDLGLASGPYRGTLSIGITLFQGRQSAADKVLKQAEVALARAKQDGRNAIRFFSETMQAVTDARAELELKLRAAIAENGFKLYYQPQINRDGRVVGAEALIRCFDAQGKMISPASFIPLAEETGLIVPIGEWVLNAACAQLFVWQQHDTSRGYTLAINVSAKQFHQPDFVDKVQSAIARHRIPPEKLKIELTESAVLGDIETTVSRMHEIKALGVKFALDDFGTGYSSLSYLKRLPFDQLKIDQIFVRDMAQYNSSEAIVRAILAISRSLELEVVAEGVETPAQHELLLTRGCEMFQGYLFGKPVPIENWGTP